MKVGKWGLVCCRAAHCPLAPSVPSPPLVLPCPLFFPKGGMGDRHLVNPKRARPPPKGAVQSIPVESGEHVQEFKVKQKEEILHLASQGVNFITLGAP